MSDQQRQAGEGNSWCQDVKSFNNLPLSTVFERGSSPARPPGASAVSLICMDIMEAEQDRTQGQTGAHSEDLGHQYVQRPSGSRCLLSCGGKMLVKSTEYTNTDIHARLGIYLRLEKDAFTFQLTLCCEISSVFKVSGSNLTSFPHMEQSKHRFDLKTCRLLYADIFLFTGNQTVTSAVQEEGETVPSLI